MSLQSSVSILNEPVYQLRACENEYNIPRIMGPLALAPNQELSRTICLALD